MSSKKKTKKAGKKVAKPAARKRAAPKRAAAKKAAPRRAAAKGAAHPIVHWEIQSKNPGQLHTFYANALGWKIDTNNPMQYGMISGAGKDTIGGGIGPAMDATSRVTVYVQVPDINETLDRATSLGGETMVPRTPYGPVIMALFRDLEGNVIGLVED